MSRPRPVGPTVVAATATDAPLLLVDTTNLDSDGVGWREVNVRSARVRVERRTDGWWLLADPDVEVAGIPVVGPMALGATARISCPGAPELKLTVDPPPRPVWDFWVDADIGPRFRQEDAASANTWFLSVADGVGSRPTPDVASSGVIGAVTAAAVVAGGTRAISMVAEAAEAAMVRLIDDGVGARGMMTTLTAAFASLTDDGVVVYGVHVGDSALLWFHESTAELEMVTTPHHLPNQPNTLLRAIGDGSAPVLDPFKLTVRPGDVLVACTDGLTGVVGLSELARLIAEHHNEGPAALAEELVGAAIVAGTRDNVSVAVAVLPLRPGKATPSAQSPVLMLPRPDPRLALTSEE